MENKALRLRIFWVLALVGVWPAILSNSLLPFDWFDSHAFEHVSPWLFAWQSKLAYCLTLASAAVLVVLDRRLILLIALLPLAILAALPLETVSLDMRLLSDPAQLARLAREYHDRPQGLIDPDRANAAELSARIKTALQLPALAKTLHLAPGAEDYAAQWTSDSEADLAKALTPLVLPIDQVGKDLEAAADQYCAYRDALGIRVVATLKSAAPYVAQVAGEIKRLKDAIKVLCDQPVEPMFRCPTAPEVQLNDTNNDGRFTAEDCEEPRVRERHRSETLTPQVEELRVAVDAAAAKAQADHRAEVVSAIEEAEGRIYALQQAGNHAMTWMLSFVYCVASFITLILFAVWGRVRSLATLVTVGVTAALAYSSALNRPSTEDDFFGWLGGLVELVLVTLSPAMLFVVSAAVLRLTALAIGQNLLIANEVGHTNIIRHLPRAFLYWSPLLLVFLVIGLPLSAALDNLTREALYAAEFTATRDETDEPQATRLLLRQTGDLEADIDTSVNEHLKAQEAELIGGLQNWTAEADTWSNDVTVDLNEHIEDAIPRALGCPAPGMQAGPECLSPEYYAGYRCGWLDFGCRVMRGVKRVMNDVYIKTRSNTVSQIMIASSDSQEVFQATVETNAKAAQEQLEGAFKSAREEAKLGIWRIFRLLNLLQMLSLASLITAGIKSFLFVFARFAFATDGGEVVHFMEPNSRARSFTHPIKTPARGEYKFTLPGKYLIKGRDIDDGGSFFHLPVQPFRAVIGRLLSGSYLMNAVIVEPGEEGRKGYKPEGARDIVSWTLKPEEEVFFNWKDLVALGDTLTIQSVVSLRMTSMYLGRMFFASVTGPGTLVLQTRGTPLVSTATEVTPDFSPRRLLVLSRNARFRVRSRLTFSDVYMSDVQLDPELGAGVAADVDRPTGNIFGRGAIRYLVAFLLPI